MTLEANLWATVRRNLLPHGRLLRIESPLTEPGVPDVCYCVGGHAGWLELKEVAAWPARDTTPLRVPHLTLEQVLFAESWHDASGACHTLLQVDRDYLLLDAAGTRAVYERTVTRTELIGELAVVYGRQTFPTTEVLFVLQKDGRFGHRVDPQRTAALLTPSRKKDASTWD